MFLKSLTAAHAARLHFKTSKIRVPYVPMPLEDYRTAVEVRAVTTDFDIEEIEGIAFAFEDLTGADKELHLENLLVRCEVHYDRDIRRRANRLSKHEEGQVLKAIQAMHRSETEMRRRTTGPWYNQSITSGRHGSRRTASEPWLYRVLSNMRKEDLDMAFRDTNAVESPNRRVNLICGKKCLQV